MKSQFPNMVTSCNLICGCISVIFAITGSTETALLFIIIGAVFDFGDGFSARALKVSSPIGKELDSLADVITFGFAPSAIVFYELSILDYHSSLSLISNYIPYLALLIAAFSALRLAKFNIDVRQTTSFIGLPTPANALLWGSIIVGYHNYFENTDYGYIIILVLIFISSYLLICEMPMFALKFKHWGLKENDNIVKYIFIIFSLVVFFAFLIAGIPIQSIALIILAYILVSFIMWRKKSPYKTL